MAYHVHAVGIVCPICNCERKPSGSRMIGAVQIGGKVMSEESIEAELNFNPDDDSGAFWNDEKWFEEKYVPKLEEKNNLANYGELPPVEPADNHSKKVFAEAMAKKG